MKKGKIHLLGIILMLLSAFPGMVCSQTDWKKDFKYQELKNRPDLEVRYTNGDRDAFEIVAADYQLTGDLVPPNLLYDSSSQEPWLWFEMTDQQGNLYSTRNTKTLTRINLYRRGPYYCEIHWMDVKFADQKGDTLPLRAEVVLYCFPEKVKSSVKLFPSAKMDMKNFAVKGKSETVLAIQPLEKQKSQYFNFDLYREEPPLSDNSFSLVKGLTPVRYDQRKGVYTIGSETAQGFQRQYFEQPNGYEEVTFKVKNNATPRKIYICQRTLKGEGIVEGGAVLDARGHPLPILVQVSKNFDGEKEERFYNPKDTAFSETFFPLYLEPNEEVEISSLHLYQNWGRHMTKHWSSLGFFMDYFHSSTGVTETTCYIPFKFGHKTGISIGDFRAMSQETFWGGQPQHDNLAGHNFLTYYDGRQWNYSEYRGTTYKSTGPNWCNVEMEYLSSDSCIQLLLDIWEVPQDDELRSFFTARYKVLRPLVVEDARANFRFLDISTTQQSLRYTNFAYTSGAGNTITNPIDFNLTPFCVKGVEIPSENSFATIFGEPKGSNGIMIRKFESNSGLKPAFSIQQKSHLAEPVDTTVNEHKVYTPGFHKGDIRFSLVPAVDRLVLKPGDEISISGFWLPYGESNGAKTPAREIIAFGKESPQVVAVKKGYVLNNLPTTIQVENNEAWFTLKGGLNVIPVIAKGFRNYQYPALYEKIGDKWEFIHLGQTGPFDGLQLFCDKDGAYGAVFLVRTNGQAREFRIKSNEPFPDLKKLSLLPKSSARAEVTINNPFEKLPVILKIDNQVFPGPVRWNESEGKSFWFTGSVKDTISGARVTGFEEHVTIQYWWENYKIDHMIRSPKFELEIGANLFGGKFKAFYYSNGRLTECVALKKAMAIETAELSLGLRPAVIVLYNAELNYCIALSFKNGSSLFFKKNSFGVVMSPQNCPKIRRKVMEGNVYFMPGGPAALQKVIEQELPVWRQVIKN